MADEMLTRSEFLEYMKAFEERFNSRMAVQLEQINSRMAVQFEETRALIRLSLEGLDALRETTERGFVEVHGEIHENKALLESALKHEAKS